MEENDREGTCQIQHYFVLGTAKSYQYKIASYASQLRGDESAKSVTLAPSPS